VGPSADLSRPQRQGSDGGWAIEPVRWWALEESRSLVAGLTEERRMVEFTLDTDIGSDVDDLMALPWSSAQQR
jgi:hypothetical protein